MEEKLRIIALEYDKGDVYYLKEILRRRHCTRITVQDDDSVKGWAEVRFMATDEDMLSVIDRLKYTLNANDTWLLKKVI